MLKSLFLISSKHWQDIITVVWWLKNNQKVCDFIYIIVINNLSSNINYELHRGFKLVGQGEIKLGQRLKHIKMKSLSLKNVLEIDINGL